MPTSPTSAPSLEGIEFLGQDQEARQTLIRLEKARRAWVGDYGHDYPGWAEKVRRQVADDLPMFFDNFAWTYEPRNSEWLPMVLFPRQREYVRFVMDRVADGEDFLCEKSRDVGVTYLNCGIAVNRFLFMPGFKTTFCANLMDLVDELGNPDSIFEKIRIILRRMPPWMRPKAWREDRCSRQGRIINPDNMNTIIGEGGENAGRGGRSTLYFIDEAAHIARADRVNAATSANTRTRGWCSSVDGMGNLFARLAHGDKVKKFRLHWKDDPRKDNVWAANEKDRLGPTTFAAEHDIDYGASIEGLIILKAWIDAAVELRKMLGPTYKAPRGTAGLDVGAGKAESVCVIIKGSLVLEPEGWRNPDLIDTAYRGLAHAQAQNVGLLNYDLPGVGYGVAAVFNRASTPDMTIQGVNTGSDPDDIRWPDGRSARQIFQNKKAMLWWRARERFQNSYQHWRHLLGEPDGIAHNVEDVLLMCEDIETRRQLNIPTWTKGMSGKIMVETKDQLRGRQIPSPDRADAFVLALDTLPLSAFFVG